MLNEIEKGKQPIEANYTHEQLKLSPPGENVGSQCNACTAEINQLRNGGDHVFRQQEPSVQSQGRPMPAAQVGIV